MKTNKQIATDALQRAEELRLRKQKRKRAIYTLALTSGCLFAIIALSFSISAVLPSMPPEASGTYSDTLFASGGSGGYMLIGVIGFALGAVTAYFIFRRQEKK